MPSSQKSAQNVDATSAEMTSVAQVLTVKTVPHLHTGQLLSIQMMKVLKQLQSSPTDLPIKLHSL